uniref:Uncharacterized protein n=1 Tax=Trypanosoma vivax (strain Y486) TaxID=1055687 RepID=G0TUG4_TRYVY|nr:conserved hypothetical protein [Trypanosoma vivax Y486]
MSTTSSLAREDYNSCDIMHDAPVRGEYFTPLYRQDGLLHDRDDQMENSQVTGCESSWSRCIPCPYRGVDAGENSPRSTYIGSGQHKCETMQLNARSLLRMQRAVADGSIPLRAELLDGNPLRTKRPSCTTGGISLVSVGGDTEGSVGDLLISEYSAYPTDSPQGKRRESQAPSSMASVDSICGSTFIPNLLSRRNLDHFSAQLLSGASKLRSEVLCGELMKELGDSVGSMANDVAISTWNEAGSDQLSKIKSQSDLCNGDELRTNRTGDNTSDASNPRTPVYDGYHNGVGCIESTFNRRESGTSRVDSLHQRDDHISLVSAKASGPGDDGQSSRLDDADVSELRMQVGMLVRDINESKSQRAKIVSDMVQFQQLFKVVMKEISQQIQITEMRHAEFRATVEKKLDTMRIHMMNSERELSMSMNTKLDAFKQTIEESMQKINDNVQKNMVSLAQQVGASASEVRQLANEIFSKQQQNADPGKSFK